MQNQQHVSFALNRLIVGAEQPFDLHALWQSTSRTLSNLDFEHQHEVQRVVLRDNLDWECAAIRMVIGCRGGHDDCRAATQMQALC